MRIKRPDHKDALSLIEAAHSDMKFTFSMKVTPQSASTIIRNIYECFRMLGDALLTLRGVESSDHIQPIQELLALPVETPRPLQIIDTLRKFRHNINYYGYKPSVEEAEEAISIAKSCFEEVYNSIQKMIDQKK